MAHYSIAKGVKPRRAADRIEGYYKAIMDARTFDELKVVREKMVSDGVILGSYYDVEGDGYTLIRDSGTSLKINRPTPPYPADATDEQKRRIDRASWDELDRQYKESLVDAMKENLAEGLENVSSELFSQVSSEKRASATRALFQAIAGKNLKSFLLGGGFIRLLLFGPILMYALPLTAIIINPIVRARQRKRNSDIASAKEKFSSLHQAIEQGKEQKQTRGRVALETLVSQTVRPAQEEEQTEENRPEDDINASDVQEETSEEVGIEPEQTLENRRREMDDMRAARDRERTERTQQDTVEREEEREKDLEDRPVTDPMRPADHKDVVDPDIVKPKEQFTPNEAPQSAQDDIKNTLARLNQELSAIEALRTDLGLAPDGQLDLYRDSIQMQVANLGLNIPGVEESAKASLNYLLNDLVRERVSLQGEAIAMHGFEAVSPVDVQHAYEDSLKAISKGEGHDVQPFLMQNGNGNLYVGYNQLALQADFARGGYSVPIYLSAKDIAAIDVGNKNLRAECWGVPVTLFYTEDGKVKRQSVYNIENLQIPHYTGGKRGRREWTPFKDTEEFKKLKASFDAKRANIDTSKAEQVYKQLVLSAKSDSDPAITDCLARAISGLGGRRLSEETVRELSQLVPTPVNATGRMMDMTARQSTSSQTPADERLFKMSDDATTIMSAAVAGGICTTRLSSVEDIVQEQGPGQKKGYQEEDDEELAAENDTEREESEESEEAEIDF